MANPEHLEKLIEGVEAWNTWRIANPGISPDLSEANLFEANLVEANLHGANLSGAFLIRAYLLKANLHGADLSGADILKANLHGADLSGAILKGAVLMDANLYLANLSGAVLSGADLTRADLRGADLTRADLSGAELRRANLMEANLSGAVLSGADLREASLVETDLENADLTACRIYGVSVWNVKLQNTKQTNLVITPEDEPAITVDNLELAQFIYLLLKYEKLRDVLNTVTQRGVLLLGRFGDGGLELLQAIADKLREFNYIPIIFDFDRPESRDYTETVKTLVGLSRFVIVELSGPSVPQELYATVPHFKIPFVPIMRKGSRHYAMFTDLLAYPWVLSPVEFENMESLLELIPAKIIEPAEDKAKARQDQLSNLFNR
ncbi:MAG: pentapeptide repeat-containing protein [Desulfobaccales bacterium]